MAIARPLINIYDADTGEKTNKQPILLPKVCTSPLRPDIVRYIHRLIMLNSRVPHAPKRGAGFGTAAESWGTGRAVARIPRVPGGGTHRAGQGAFGNMCRGGPMSHPIMLYRRWGRKIPKREKRNAVCSSIAASCIPALVMAHGHKIDQVPEVPLVITDNVMEKSKTRQVKEMLGKLGCAEELEKVNKSIKQRAGKGKSRNRRWRRKKGVLIVYHTDGPPPPLLKGARNLQGCEVANATRLNLLDMAPGGLMGRFVIWTEGAFNHLKKMYEGETAKKRYHLRQDVLTNADVQAIINSEAVQSVLRPKKEVRKNGRRKANPLVNVHYRKFLDPTYGSEELKELRKSFKNPEEIKHGKRARRGFLGRIEEAHGVFKKLNKQNVVVEARKDDDEDDE